MPDKHLFNREQLIAAALSADTNRDGKVNANEAVALAQAGRAQNDPAKTTAGRGLDLALYYKGRQEFALFGSSYTLQEVRDVVGKGFADIDFDKNHVVSQSEYDFVQTLAYKTGLGDYNAFKAKNAETYR